MWYNPVTEKMQRFSSRNNRENTGLTDSIEEFSVKNQDSRSGSVSEKTTKVDSGNSKTKIYLLDSYDELNYKLQKNKSAGRPRRITRFNIMKAQLNSDVIDSLAFSN